MLETTCMTTIITGLSLLNKTRYGPKPTQRIGGTHFDPSIKRLYAYSEDRPDVIVVKMVEYSDSIAMTRQEFEDQFVIGE